MAIRGRRHRVEIRRRERVSDGRHGHTWPETFDDYTPVSTVWAMVSPTLGGGRRERQLFGPRTEFEMNAMGQFHYNTDIRVTDMLEVLGDKYEVLAVVDSLYMHRAKFAALKTKPELPS